MAFARVVRGLTVGRLMTLLVVCPLHHEWHRKTRGNKINILLGLWMQLMRAAGRDWIPPLVLGSLTFTVP